MCMCEYVHIYIYVMQMYVRRKLPNCFSHTRFTHIYTFTNKHTLEGMSWNEIGPGCHSIFSGSCLFILRLWNGLGKNLLISPLLFHLCLPLECWDSKLELPSPSSLKISLKRSTILIFTSIFQFSHLWGIVSVLF